MVREFFELFKTPWEVYESGRPYDVVLCAGDVHVPHNAAKVVIVYSGQRHRHRRRSLPVRETAGCFLIAAKHSRVW